jgi:uncharacterized protein DUF4333
MTGNRSSAVAMPFVLAAMTFTAGCNGEVPAEQITASLVAQLQQKGISGTDISCPTLTAAPGASGTCSFRVDGQPVDAIVSIDVVVGERAHFSVITRPRPIEEGLLEQRLAVDTAHSSGSVAPDVDCPDDLAPAVGTSLVCEVDDGDRTAKVSVTGVSGGRVEYTVVIS